MELQVFANELGDVGVAGSVVSMATTAVLGLSVL